MVHNVLTRELPRPPRLLLGARLARLELRGLVRRALRAAHLGRPTPIALEELALPDSDIARRATVLARACEPEFLFNHSVRTFLFGAALARKLDLQPDLELLYLASVLHDVGLTDAHGGTDSFELHGARAARAFLLESGVGADRADLVHEAIALHSAAGIAHLREPEIALTHLGAGLDVIGFHAEDVASATREQIVRAWPRHGFKEAFERLLRSEAEAKPRCHIAGAVGLGFLAKVRAAPFDD